MLMPVALRASTSKGGRHGHICNRRSSGVRMVCIQRLVFALLFVFSANSYAVIRHPAGTVEYRLGTFKGGAQDVCAAWTNSLTTDPHGYTVTGDYCNMTAPDGHVFQNWLFSVTVIPRPLCPANSLDPGTNECVCSSGYREAADHQSCEADKGCDSFKGGSDLFTGGSMRLPGASYCPNNGVGSGCGATVTGAWATVKNGVKTWTAEVSYTGKSCTPSSGPTGNNDNEAPTPCKGQPGTVNGVPVCIPFGPQNPPSDVVTKETKTNPDGSTSEVTKHTTCEETKCTTVTTTTTTIVGPSGPTTKTDTETTDQPKDSFCKENPQSPMCKTSSFGGGDCGAQPSCDGDAIQCAVARFTFSTQCALTVEPKDSADIAAYKAEAAKGQGDQTKGITTEVRIGADSFDQSDALGSRGGLQDQVVTVAGQQITIPWSVANDKLILIGQIVQAVTFLLCLRIVFRG